MPRLSGKCLNEKWNVGARHPLYHCDGTFYECLTIFPGALFDSDGYVLFETEEAYRSCSNLQHGVKLNVPGGISSIRGYVRVTKDASVKTTS